MKPRTKWIVGLWIVALGFSGVVLLVYLNRPRRESSGVPQVQNPVEAHQSSNASQGNVLAAGNITVAPELADRARQISTVYVILRSAQGGPPYAVARLENPHEAALTFELTTANVMVQGAQPPQDARLIVRFDADGRAGAEQPGDLVGELSEVSLGSSQLAVVVSRQVMP